MNPVKYGQAKGGMQLNSDVKNLVRKIQRQAQGKHDETAPANTIKHGGQGFTFQGQVIRATRIATVQLCSLAGGVPIRVFEKLSQEQRTATFNELFEKQGDRHYMFRFNDDLLIGVVSPNYQRIDNNIMIDVIRRAASTLKLVPVKAIISPEFSFIRMIPEGATEVVHELLPCMSICNREVGLSAFRIMAGIYRLVCSNGLIVEEKQQNWRWLHYGPNTEVKPDLSEVMYVANQHVRYLDNTRGRYLSIEDKIQFANSVKRDLGVKVATGFISAANNSYSGGRDWFCTINALTAASQSFSPLKQLEIEEFAGRLLARKEVGLN